MITIIAFLVFLCISYCIFKETYFGLSDKIGMSVVIFLMIAVITMIMCLPLNEFVFKSVEIGRTDYKANIYSIKNVNGISGNFVLGSGMINSSEYYYTFTKTNNGGFHRERFYSQNCYVFQDENKNPYMNWQVIHYRVSRWISVWPQFKSDKNSMYDIHVPTNTIIEQYKIE